MDWDVDSTDRKPTEYVLFALGFLGFILAASGIALTSPVLAVLGGIVLIFSVYSFYGKRSRDM